MTKSALKKTSNSGGADLSFSDLRSNSGYQQSRELIDRRNKTRFAENENCDLPDGGFGWVVVISCFFIEGFVFGTIRCLSIFFIRFQEAFDANSNSVSWIPSISLAMLHATGAITSALNTRFGPRKCVMLGGFLSSLGFIISSTSTNLVCMYLSLGALTGFGFGLAYIPSNVAIGSFFHKRRVLAYCITSTGGHALSFVFAPLFQTLLDTYAWWKVLRIIGAMMLTIVLCGIVISPPENKTSNDNKDKVTFKPELKKEELNRPSPCQIKIHRFSQEDNLWNRNNWNYKSFSGFPTELIQKQSKRFKPSKRRISFAGRNETRERAKTQSESTISYVGNLSVIKEIPQFDDTISSQNSSIEINLNEADGNKKVDSANEKSTLFLGLEWVLWTKCSFVLYCFSGLCIGAGAFTPNLFLYPHFVKKGLNTFDAALLLSVMSSVCIVSSLVSGWFTTLLSVKILYFDVASLFALALSSLLCPLANSYSELVIFCLCFGLFTGCVMALPFSVLAEIVGERYLPSAIGFFLMVTSVAVLVTPPVAGWLADVTGSYDAVFYLSGVTLMLASIIILGVALGTKLPQQPNETIPYNVDAQNENALAGTSSLEGSDKRSSGIQKLKNLCRPDLKQTRSDQAAFYNHPNYNTCRRSVF